MEKKEVKKEIEETLLEMKKIDEMKWNEKWKEKNEDEITSSLIYEIMKDTTTISSHDTPIVEHDLLYSQRIYEIDHIINKEEKSDKICWYACSYAFERKELAFISLLERYNLKKEIIWNREFEYKRDREKTLLNHLASTADNLKCVRYILEKDMITPIEYESAIDDALGTAVTNQSSEGIKVLMNAKYMDNKDKRMKEYAEKQIKEKSKCQELLIYLKKEKEYEIVMKTLSKCIISMIKHNKKISSDVFNLCWLYHKDSLWDAMYDKCQQLITMDTLSDNIHAYKWLEEHVIENTDLLIWLEEDEKKKDLRQIKWDKITQISENISFQQEQTFSMQMKQEIDLYESEYQTIMQLKYPNINTNILNNNDNNNNDNNNKLTMINLKKKWRQDEHKLGMKFSMNEKQVEKIQMDCKNVAFNVENIYEFDFYLNELLIRAHRMDESYQSEMKKIFENCEGCTFESIPVKTYEKCKSKTPFKNKNEHFPKTAHIIDVLKCRATFETILDLNKGLQYALKYIMNSSNRNKFEILRFKNGFSHQRKRRKNKNEEKEENLYSKQLKLPIPTEYKEIKINIIYILNQESIVSELQLTLKSMIKFARKQRPLDQIIQRESFILGSLMHMQQFSFDFQLKISCFNKEELAELMLFHPNEFRRSKFILYDRDMSGGNFISQMAFNSKIQYPCAKTLLQSGNFIPIYIVQAQLMETANYGVFCLMFALWKQPSIECIELFIPSDPHHAQFAWNALDQFQTSCIDFGMRNQHIEPLLILKLLKQNISDDQMWEKLIKTTETEQGFTPLRTTAFYQSHLNKEVLNFLVPHDYHHDFEFWQGTCNESFNQRTLLHLLFNQSLPNVWTRLSALHEYMPKESWQKLLLTIEMYGRTPLMDAVLFVPEMDEKIMSLLIPENGGDAMFWGMHTNDRQSGYDLRGCNLLHLSVANKKDNAWDCLKCLRQFMPHSIWNQLLYTPNRTLAKETPIEMAHRISKSNQILSLLIEHV